VAARELCRGQEARLRVKRSLAAVDVVTAMLTGYVRHALAHPQLFRLTYGPWRTGSAELVMAADEARTALVQAVAAAQASGDLPPGAAQGGEPPVRRPQAPMNAKPQARKSLSPGRAVRRLASSAVSTPAATNGRAVAARLSW
jgi:hypothetical protein